MLIINLLKDSSKFTYAEEPIVNYILEHPKKCANASIGELAEWTFCSKATITRLSKKLGCKGFTDLKNKLLTELTSFELEKNRISADLPVQSYTSNEHLPEIFYKLHLQALTDIKNTIDIHQLETVCDIFEKSDHISFFGVGPSLLIAEDFLYKARRLGYPFYADSLNGFEASMLVRGKKNPVCFIVSQYANSERVINWVKRNKIHGRTLILLTTNAKSPILKFCDQVILVDCKETLGEKMGSFVSRTGMLYTMDILYMILFKRNYSENMKRLRYK